MPSGIWSTGVWVDTPSSQRPDATEAKFTHTHTPISLKLGAKVCTGIKHRDFSYVWLSHSLAKSQEFGGRDDQPEAYVIWDCFLFGDKRELWNESSVSYSALTVFHAITFMWITGLVSMATPFTKIDQRSLLKRFLSFPPTLPGTSPFYKWGALLPIWADILWSHLPG